MEACVEIKLTQGQYTIIDDDVYDYVKHFNWCALRRENTYYAVAKLRRGYNLAMHHLVIGVPLYGYVVDHINRNGIDNRKENLRVVTNRQNSHNTTTKKSSSFPGVSWVTRDKIWSAHASINGKVYALGNYIKEIDAAVAYKLSIESMGEQLLPEMEELLMAAIQEDKNNPKRKSFREWRY